MTRSSSRPTAALAMSALLAVVCTIGAGACVYTPLVTSLRGIARPASSRVAFDQLRGSGGSAAITFLDRNPAAWAARWSALSAARDSIDSTYFIVADDVFGVAFLAHLYVRALNGVQVRLLVDGRGSLALTLGIDGADYLQELAAIGVDVHVFNPPFAELAEAFATMTLVPLAAGTHNKTLVVDGRRAIVGGRNIGAEYFVHDAASVNAFEDFDVVLDGEAPARALTDAVDVEMAASMNGIVMPEVVDVVPRGDELIMVYAAMDAWLRGAVTMLPRDEAAIALEANALARLPVVPARAVREAARAHIEQLVEFSELWGTLSQTQPASESAEVRIVSARSRALDNDDIANASLIRCLGSARTQIGIETPYFVLTPRLLLALQDASLRGVQIDVFTNSALSSDNDVAEALFVDSAPEILARVPGLRIFVPNDTRALHVKRITIDDELTLIGTYNFDPFSAHLNSETIIGVWSRTMTARTKVRLASRLTAAYEYRVQRDSEGRVNRFPNGHPYAGQPVMVFGPRDHVPAERMRDLQNLKAVLVGARHMWDFEVLVW